MEAPDLKRQGIFVFNISWRITLVYALLFSLVLFLLSACLLYGIKFYFSYQGEQQVLSVETYLEKSILGNSEIRNLQELNDEMLTNVPATDNVSVFILDSNKHLLVPQQTTKQRQELYRFVLEDLEHHHDENGKFVGLGAGVIQHKENDEHHLVYISKGIPTTKYGVIYVQVIKDLTNFYDFLKILFVLLLIFDAIGILSSLLVGHIVSKRTLRPIDTITKTAQSISAHDLSQRIDIKGPEDELVRLARTFNNMIARLEAAFDRQKQFVGDASHELRTPVAVIKGYANMINRWGKGDQDALNEGINAIINETNNMEHLLERLLFLANRDNGEEELDLREFALDTLVKEIASESQLLAPNHKIEMGAETSVTVYADPGLIKEALRAVIDNSIKFTPINGTIQLDIKKRDTNAIIIVRDTGSGIPEDDLPHVFERFYRGDKSRTRRSGSSGLGLSIAKWIVEAHGGTINVDSTIGKGTVVEIRLPTISE